MRILPFMPSAEGYEPPLPERNQEEGILEISHPADCTLIEETKIVAETLILRCSLQPLPLINKAIKVGLISEGEALENTLLYEKEAIAFGYDQEIENSQWQALALKYTDIGHGIYRGKPFTFWGKTLPSGRLEIGQTIYVKPFRVESQNHQERHTTFASGQILTSPPGILDARILRGYGGYYKEGIALDKIQQIYYSLTSTHNHTRVRLVSSSTLQQQQILPPQGGMGILFNPDPQKEEYLTLPAALAAGYAHINVSTELGETQFSSFLCEPIHGDTTLINVYFTPSK